MLTKMRIEVKNERGAFMSITAPGAEARRAAPLPRAGAKPSGPIPDAGGSPARKKGEAGLLEAAQTGNVADVVALLLEGVSPNCVPADHQILTDRGFLDLDTFHKCEAAADGSVRVAGYDPATQELVYERPLALHEVAHDTHSMVRMADGESGIDLLVSRDHDVYVQLGERADTSRCAASFSTPPFKLCAGALLDDANVDAVRQFCGAAGGSRGCFRADSVGQFFVSVAAGASWRVAARRGPSANARACAGEECDETDDHSDDHSDSMSTESTQCVRSSRALAALYRLYGAWIAAGSLEYDAAHCVTGSVWSVRRHSVSWFAEIVSTLTDGDEECWTLHCEDAGDAADDCVRVTIANARWIAMLGALHAGRRAERAATPACDKKFAWWVWLLDGRDALSVLDGVCRLQHSVSRDWICGSMAEARSASARDELIRLGLHAGLSPQCALQTAGREEKSKKGATTVQWRVEFSSNESAQDAYAPTLSRQRRHIRQDGYSGRLWCFTMPSGFIWVRSVQKDANGAVVGASRAVLTGSECRFFHFFFFFHFLLKDKCWFFFFSTKIFWPVSFLGFKIGYLCSVSLWSVCLAIPAIPRGAHTLFVTHARQCKFSQTVEAKKANRRCWLRRLRATPM